jgi:hypothetical protein
MATYRDEDVAGFDVRRTQRLSWNCFRIQNHAMAQTILDAIGMDCQREKDDQGQQVDSHGHFLLEQLVLRTTVFASSARVYETTPHIPAVEGKLNCLVPVKSLWWIIRNCYQRRHIHDFGRAAEKCSLTIHQLFEMADQGSLNATNVSIVPSD